MNKKLIVSNAIALAIIAVVAYGAIKIKTLEFAAEKTEIIMNSKIQNLEQQLSDKQATIDAAQSNLK